MIPSSWDEPAGSDVGPPLKPASVLLENRENPRSKIAAFIARLVKTCSRFSPDEIIAIFRPVVYMWSLIKSGVNSYRPIIISLLLDLAQLIIGIVRLRRSGEEGKSLSVVEKNEIA